MKIIKFKSSTPAGDLLAMLAGIKNVCEDLDAKAIIYQRLGMVGVGYNGAVHPFKNENGDEVCMNEYMFNVLKPLLIKLEYIEDFIIYTGQEYEYDLDKGRMEVFTNMPLGSINRWIFHVFPQMSCDLSQKWIDLNGVKPHTSSKICVNFTFRYRNPLVDYHFLKKYEDKIYFIGMENEYDFFCKQWGLDIEYKKTENYFDVHNCIKQSLFFIGNQSSCFQVAEGMKHPRILELCQMMPNVIPIGEHAHDFYHQGELEYYVEKMLNLIYIC